jgi:hypothetical protein
VLQKRQRNRVRARFHDSGFLRVAVNTRDMVPCVTNVIAGVPSRDFRRIAQDDGGRRVKVA